MSSTYSPKFTSLSLQLSSNEYMKAMFSAAKWLPICNQSRLPITICRNMSSMAVVHLDLTVQKEPQKGFLIVLYVIYSPVEPRYHILFRTIGWIQVSSWSAPPVSSCILTKTWNVVPGYTFVWQIPARHRKESLSPTAMVSSDRQPCKHPPGNAGHECASFSNDKFMLNCRGKK